MPQVVASLQGVGKKTEKSLAKLGLLTVNDCAFYFPREYDDRRQLPMIKELESQKVTTCSVIIEYVTEKKIKKGLHVIEAQVFDKTGRLTATWFNQAYLLPLLRPGLPLVIKGKCEENMFTHSMHMQVQATDILRSSQDVATHTGCILPVYKLTAGLYQSQLRAIIKQAVTRVTQAIRESLPSAILTHYGFPALKDALHEIHYPQAVETYKKARARLVFDEFFFYQLRLEKQRRTQKKNTAAPCLLPKNTLTAHYRAQLPYRLTRAQERAIEDIFVDCQQSTAMNRLLQGDVGSGKTDVAFMAVLRALENDRSGVIMAPTEILAMQHYKRVRHLCDTLGIRGCLLKGKMKKKERDQAIAFLQSDQPCIIVGTHALIETYVVLSKCGVIIIDEQHRFGVMQRIRLQEKANESHCLFMTATPIPRSYMLTCYGDLDKSIIDELPPGRLPPQTICVTEDALHHVYQICRQRLQKGQQVYVVYPLIEESEKMDLKSAQEGFEAIKAAFSDMTVGLIHGRLKADEKEKIMTDFKQNQCQILVSTTVIEVGVDVPNATVMLIHDADRFGLSQLHQLRGRIGRGKVQSLCYLVSQTKAQAGKKRLSVMEKTQDGFKLAEYDMAMRGPGDMLGTKQSGLPQFNLADLVKDETVLIEARKCARALLDTDPTLQKACHRLLHEGLAAYQQRTIEEYLN